MSHFKLSEILKADGAPAKFIGAHSGMGAALAQRAGFDGIWASGLEISTSAALPDANILSMNEFLGAAKQIRRACELPVLCDCDTGFGNSNNVIHMVREYEAAGIDGVCIEDKTFPKTNSFIGQGQVLAPIAEFVGKILAAKNAQRDPDFVVVARVEALIAGLGQEEAMRRATAYAEAGADAILMHSKSKDPEEVMTFLRSWKGRTPVVLVPTTYPTLDLAAAGALNCRLVIYANQGLRAAVTAMESVFDEILETGSTSSVEPRIAPLSTIFDLQGMPRLKKLESQFEPKNFEMPVTILAAGEKRADRDLGALLEDRPLCMLDLGGRSLLDLQTHIYSGAKLGRQTVVVGHMSDKVRCEGAEILVNPDWRSSGSAGSALMSPGAGPRILAYGDVLVNVDHVKRLGASDHDITVLVGKAAEMRKVDKPLECVRVSLSEETRELELGPVAEVTEIGRDLAGEGVGEFLGVMRFSSAGWDRFCRVADDCRERAVLDVFDALLNDGADIRAMVVRSGWTEIHAYEDFRRAANHLDEWR